MTLDTHSIPDRDVERRLGGVGPFVINLQASTAPIRVPAKSPAGNEHARLYQLQRVDDGRVRYRLRLGPFATEDEADAMVAKVRFDYPGALMVIAAADDLHAIALVRGKTAAVAQPAPAPAPAPAPIPVLELAPAPAPVPAPAPALAPAPVVVLALAPAPAPVPVLALAPAPAPAPVPVLALAPAPAQTAAADIASMQALMAAIDGASAKPAPVVQAAARAAVHAVTPAPSFESTQTLRPLTLAELGQHETPRWFAIQLALSDVAFDPDALPHLDIFSLYRLYTVVGMDQGRLVHALRLGFFGEEVGARAVANYLAGFYQEPTIKRVSVAERDRFADQRVEARKDVGATGRHLAIEITDELVVRGRRVSR